MAPPSPSPSPRPERDSSPSRQSPSSGTPPNGAICSLEGLDFSLAQLAELDLIEAKAKQHHEKAVSASLARCNETLYVDVDGQRLAIADRRAALQRSIEQYCDAHRGELLQGPIKSLKLNAGKIGWKKTPDKLAPVEGGSVAGSAKLLDDVVAFLYAAVAKFKVLGDVALQPFKVQISMDRPAILKAVDAKLIDKRDLRKLGFVLQEGTDEFFAEPNKLRLESQPADAL